jgi:hypothetical protein
MSTEPYHVGWILYLASKDDDLVDDPSSLVLQELLDDDVTEVTSPNDGEVFVSRHELTPLSGACG